MSLADFFTTGFVDQALNAYYDHRNSSWAFSNKLRIYNEAKIAFDDTRPAEERLGHFDEVYSAVRAFSAFRNAAGRCWDSSEAFNVLRNDCHGTDRSEGLSLLSKFDTKRCSVIMMTLESLRDIKPLTGRYPFVPVSKLLHFYNPALFPMYDEAFIWTRVCWGAFRGEYETFCRDHGYTAKEFGPRFNLQYTHWAGSIMQSSDPKLMERFASWATEKLVGCPDTQHVLREIGAYYSTAFELIILGAAFLVGWA